MLSELSVNVSALLGFLLVAARVGGVFVFVPLPGTQVSAPAPRVFLTLSITLALLPFWPSPPEPDLGRLAGWLIAEAMLGIAAGLLVAFITEAFVFGAQMLSLQAGYSYASTIDPSSQSESTVLLVMAQLGSGMLFFVLGLDRQVLAALAKSLQTHPPGVFVGGSVSGIVVEAGSAVFSVGVRFVLPVIALLVMVDLAIALLSRINSQLQLLVLSFPIKMLASLALMAWLSTLFPKVLAQTADGMIRRLHSALAL